MKSAVFVMSLEPESGKSLVTLGLAEMLSQRVGRIGYFRPVVREQPGGDPMIELIRHRYHLQQTYKESFGLTTDKTRGAGSPAEVDALMAQVMAKFHQLADRCDVVLVEGTDYAGASAAFEFDLNARLATNLGAPVVLVLRGHGHRADQVAGAARAGLGSLADHDAAPAAVIINRVDPGQQKSVRELVADLPVPVWLLPEEPRMAHPTVRQTAALLEAEVLHGNDDTLGQDVASVKVAAMTVPHLLGHLSEGVLLITSGDRADVILTATLTQHSDAGGRVSAVLLTGGLRPDGQVLEILDTIPGPPMPLLLTERDTFTTAAAFDNLRPVTSASDSRRIALSLGLFETHVDEDALARAIDVAESTAVTPLMFEHRLLARARADKQRIVLPEGNDDRVLLAAERILQRDVCELVILDPDGSVPERAARLGVSLDGAKVIEPTKSPLRDGFAKKLFRLREAKGMSRDMAYDAIASVSMFGTMLVDEGLVDGMVSGAAHTTADTIRPALQVIRTTPGVSIVSSVFFMCLHDRVLVYGDCAVNPDPDASQLADIAISSAGTAAAFNIEPRVAMLSYSTGSSGGGGDVEKVREATAIVRERAPGLAVEGPIQYDAAVDASVAASKLPESDVAGRATVFVFPDLNTGNNTYKAVQRSADAIAIGPVLQGLRKPVNDLSRGCTVTDIFNTVAITAVQAQHLARTQNPTT
ncbi:MAG: phosphate acetyltransferase [Actinomycetota bacterium]|nr:phosphate acetyltransferase [Actinomycetota bacterium]